MLTTLSEARAVNDLIAHLAAHSLLGRPIPTRSAAIDAAVLLADSAHDKLAAGYSGEHARLVLSEGWADEQIEEPRCALCGCSEERGCEGGCEWADTSLMVDVCTQCVCKVARAAVSSGLYDPRAPRPSGSWALP